MHNFTSDIDALAHALAQSCLNRLAMEAPLDLTRTPAELRDGAGKTPTRHRGRTCLRFAIVNPLTTPDDLAAIIGTLA
jgi:hypothetical protein